MNILITGASSGLGADLANRYSSPGNNLILCGRDEALLDKVRQDGMPCLPAGGAGWEVGEFGWGTCSIVPDDLQYLDTQGRLIELVQRDFGGKVDLLILSTGVYSNCNLFDKPNMERIAEVFTSTLSANMLTALYMLPYIKAAKGQIVHMNSVAGRNLAPGEAVYSAAKHAMAGFLKSIRFEAREHGVRVMDVFLGGIDTPMTADRAGHEKLMGVDEVSAVIVSTIRLNRMNTLQIEELQLGRLIF